MEGFWRDGNTAEVARKRIEVGCNWCDLPGTYYT